MKRSNDNKVFLQAVQKEEEMPRYLNKVRSITKYDPLMDSV